MKDKNSQRSQNSKSNEPPYGPDTDPATKELIKSALSSFLQEKLNERNVSRKNLEALINVVEEFLNSFIILGYTFDGTPVHYICAHNQQEADSLATLINKFFITAALSNNNDQSL